MKENMALLAVTLLMLFFTACSNSDASTVNPGGAQTGSESIAASDAANVGNSNSKDVQEGSNATVSAGEATNITLTIGDKVLNAQVNNTTAAKDLISRLPIIVKLNDSDNDFCGDITPALSYEESEIQHGYKDGELAFWTAGDDFVIFVDDEELSANTGNLVNLGRITDDLSVFDQITGSINVSIKLAEK